MMQPRCRHWGKFSLYIIIICAIFGLVYADNDSTPYDVKKLSRVALIIDERYAEKLEPEKIVESGINGMVTSLDPYCRYLTDNDFNEFMENTFGQFDGIGIEVDIRQNCLTVISVLDGTPAYRAGLKPGDKIISIDGKLTSEISRDNAAELMRGKAGTEVNITTRRYGASELMNYTLVRETVETESIPFYSILSDGIGYIRLTRFTETSYYEMIEALTSLRNMNAKGIILDLRSNSGGLLIEAVKIVGLFLEGGKLIVETRGRGGNLTSHYSSNDGLSCTDLPLAVLIDEGTASAAEIVAGAIQDWDRGVLIGSRTYGKGLVQRILNLDEKSALKITTAKYYIPSGRCIQKADHAGRLDVSSGKDGFPPSDSDNGFYHTALGRRVLGGGGIKPDIIVQHITESEIIKALKRQRYFFDFAVGYMVENHTRIDSNFVATSQIIRQFQIFLKGEGFNYQPEFELRYDSLLAYLPQGTISDRVRKLLDELGDSLDYLKFAGLDKENEPVKWILAEEILSIEFGPKARYGVVWVNHHPEILKAREVLSSMETYRHSFLASIE